MKKKGCKKEFDVENKREWVERCSAEISGRQTSFHIGDQRANTSVHEITSCRMTGKWGVESVEKRRIWQNCKVKNKYYKR